MDKRTSNTFKLSNPVFAAASDNILEEVKHSDI
jgi:hypothetical protein